MKITESNIEKIIKSEEECIGCKQCMKGCPMLDKYCNSPKTLLKDLKDTKEFQYSLPFSCMQCGYCNELCPKSVDLKGIFLELRRDTVKNYDGSLPKDLNTSGIDLHQNLSFSNIFTSDIQNLQSDTVFFPGCALLSHSPKIVENTYYYLRENIEGIGIYTKCCGKPTKYTGKEDKFNEYYSILEKEFRLKGVKKVITGCQNCFMTIRENSSDLEVTSLWEEIASAGIPDAKKVKYLNLDRKFTIHDPCPTRNEKNIHASARKIIDDLGLVTEEMTYNKEKTLCCGAGAMVSMAQKDIADRHIRRRAGEANTQDIISYCQECVYSMRKGGKSSYHILDLLFNEDIEDIKQKSQGLVNKWVNRYKSKKIGK
ncbi:MAG: heterodisulfide reductase-related iron-sulfur binding cluster [Senegalia sp. (in: firmicutes)]|uniref:heterodisulfide reductase-related iron-sulfur binding cluster n=1 Tax=Senegalia sp. (in: firmicutes) TaxID=1924098 RepID=UPI003F980D9F